MRLDDKALQQLFLAARTNRAWLPRDVPDSVLKELVDLMKMGPTANNGLPARVTFVRSKAAKERLIAFYARPPKGQDPLKAFEGKPEVALTYALRNGSLQGAYFMMAARALGLDVGPMSGFDNAGVDKEFFAGTDVKSNFLCNVGYGDPAALRPRGPRFAFDEMAQII
jgi:3-hydroxypropanoate dehydrogenase